MPSVAQSLQALVGAATTPVAPTVSAGGVQLYGFAGPDGIVLEGAETGLLPYPVATLVEYAPGDRVALTLIGQRPVIIGRVGGGSPSQWVTDVAIDGVQDAVETVQADVYATNAVVVAHEGKLAEVEAGVQATKDLLAATDDVVDGLAVEVSRQTVDIQGAVQAADAADEKASQAINIANVSAAQLRYAFEPEPPADPVEGAVWFPRNEDGQVTGMWQWNGEVWGTHATLTGLLLVPTADGGQTLIGPDGVEATQVVADVLRSKVLYAEVAGVETLVITDIPRQNLASDVGDALATAEELGSRIVLSGGKLTIARNRVNSSDPLTAMTLGATSLDFVVDDKPVAYIDSELEQMSVANVLARDSLHVGVHQWRTLPGTDVTVAQFVGAVS